MNETICGLSQDEIKWLLHPTRVQEWDLYIPARKVQAWAKTLTSQILVNDTKIKIIQATAAALGLGRHFNPWHGGMAFYTPNGISVTAKRIQDTVGANE